MKDTRSSSAIADRRRPHRSLASAGRRFSHAVWSRGCLCRSPHNDHGRSGLIAAGTPGVSHLVRVPGAPAARAWRPAARECPRSPLGGRRGGGTALLATSSARPGSPATGWIVAAASRSAAARIAAIWLPACCRTAAAARSAASWMALTSAHAHCVMLAAWPSARLRIRHACQSESVSRNRPA